MILSESGKAHAAKVALMARASAIALCAAGAALLGGGGAWAQAAPSPAKAKEAAQPSTALEEVIVTARRVEERLQDVPVAVSAFNGKKLEDLSVTNNDALTKLSPSLVTGPVSGIRDEAAPTIRGFGTSFGGDSSVIVYYAEVPNYPTQYSYFDLQDIQVLNGPQGTLFGETAVGGAILYQPKLPTSTYEGFAHLEVGNYDNVHFTGAISGPLVGDVLTGRLALDRWSRNGYTEALPSYGDQQPVWLDDRNQIAIRASLRFKPSDRFQNLMIFDYAEENINGYSQQPYAYAPALVNYPFNFLLQEVPAASPATAASYYFFSGATPPPGMSWLQLAQAGVTKQIAAGPRAVYTNFDRSVGTRDFGFVDHADFEITKDITLRNIYGLHWSEARGTSQDLDASDIPLFDQALPGYWPRPGQPAGNDWNFGWPTRDWSEEIQIVGKSFNNRLSWQGGFYYRDSRTREYEQDSGFDVILGGNTLFGNMVLPAATCLANTQQQYSTCTGLNRSYSTRWAAYGQATYQIIDSVRFTAGYRSTWSAAGSQSTYGPVYFFTNNVRSDSTSATPIALPVGNGGVYPGATVTSVSQPVERGDSYNLTLDWKPNATTLLYFTNRLGFKSGGINANIPQGSPDRFFGPEKVMNFEGGIKADWLFGGVRVRTDLAVFHDDYTNIQEQEFANGATLYLANVAALENKGVEIQSTIVPTSWLDITGFFSYDGPKYKNWLETGDLCLTQSFRPQCAGLSPFTPITIDHANGVLTVGANTYNFTPDSPLNTMTYHAAIQPQIHLKQFIGQDITVGVYVYYLGKIVNIYNSTTVGINLGTLQTPYGTTNSLNFIPARTMADLHIEWRHVHGSNLDLGFTVTNLTNKTYFQGAAGSTVQETGISAVIPGEPRFWKFEATYNFR
jgi:iron complex outermembrane receptor protein